MVTIEPGQTRWTPTSEADIQAAIDAGTLTETHYQDVKREVGSRPGERKEHARDQASFGLDGGTLLIGVEELKEQRTWRLAPQPLEGLGERVEQIAGQLIDPPLFVTTRDIPCGDDPSRGYLVVSVPPSPTAPHMVDGIYYGRGDRTRNRLSDAEVVRLHAHREPVERIAHQALDEEIARDHVHAGERTRGHLYAVAQPVSGRRALALPLLRDGSRVLRELLNSAESMLDNQLLQFAPAPDWATQYTRRAQGAALCSHATGPGRTVVTEDAPIDIEESLLDIELREDAGLRLLMGRMTSVWGGGRGQPEAVIADGLAAAYAIRLTHWAAQVSTRTGYHGTWVIGLHADHLRGLASSVFMNNFGARYGRVIYDAPDYREVTTASHLELVERPWAVAERLVGRLVRGLGTEEYWGATLRAPAAT